MANTVTYVAYRKFAGGGVEDITLVYVVKFSGTYTTVTGETVNFNTATNPSGIELSGFNPPTTIPEGTPDFTDNVGGYGAIVGTYNAGVVQVNFQSAAGTELGTGTYPVTISNGQITFSIHNRG